MLSHKIKIKSVSIQDTFLEFVSFLSFQKGVPKGQGVVNDLKVTLSVALHKVGEIVIKYLFQK